MAVRSQNWRLNWKLLSDGTISPTQRQETLGAG